jgi:hypothetical protein
MSESQVIQVINHSLFPVIWRRNAQTLQSLPDQLLQQSESETWNPALCVGNSCDRCEILGTPPPPISRYSLLYLLRVQVTVSVHRLGIFSTWTRVSDTNTPVSPSISCSHGERSKVSNWAIHGAEFCLHYSVMVRLGNSCNYHSVSSVCVYTK